MRQLVLDLLKLVDGTQSDDAAQPSRTPSRKSAPATPVRTIVARDTGKYVMTPAPDGNGHNRAVEDAFKDF